MSVLLQAYQYWPSVVRSSMALPDEATDTVSSDESSKPSHFFSSRTSDRK